MLTVWDIPGTAGAFSFPNRQACATSQLSRPTLSVAVFASKPDDEILELADVEKEDEAKGQKQVAPFLSQGDISQDAMEVDLKDPKQARVIIYIILSLLPVLFLIPLMLGSRDLIPLDALPPVQM